MTDTLATRFEHALEPLGVPVHHTTPDGFTDTLDPLIEPPAIGVPLPYPDINLPDTITVHPTPRQLAAAHTGVTPADAGIANYGTLIIPSTPDGHEPVSLYPDRHIAVLPADDLVPDIPDAITHLDTAFTAGHTSAVLATGPSATGDMGALVTGVHGPHTVHVILLTNE